MWSFWWRQMLQNPSIGSIYVFVFVRAWATLAFVHIRVHILKNKLHLVLDFRLSWSWKPESNWQLTTWIRVLSTAHFRARYYSFECGGGSCCIPRSPRGRGGSSTAYRIIQHTKGLLQVIGNIFISFWIHSKWNFIELTYRSGYKMKKLALTVSLEFELICCKPFLWRFLCQAMHDCMLISGPWAIVTHTWGNFAVDYCDEYLIHWIRFFIDFLEQASEFWSSLCHFNVLCANGFVATSRW